MSRPKSSANRSQDSPNDSALGRLIDELTLKLQAGEPVDLQAYIDQYPEHAEELSRMFPALKRLADLGRSEAEAERPGGFPTAWDNDGEPGVGVLGDFRLLREVGRVGMGVVYEAEQVSLSRRVALKVLPLAGSLDSKQLKRFQVEAQAAACLHHTHIVPVHAVGCERGVHYYAMQFIEGHSLAELIKGLRRLEGLEQADKPAANVAEMSASTLAAVLISGRLTRQTGGPGDQGSATAPGDHHPGSAESETAFSASKGEAAATTPGSSSVPSSSSSTRNRDYIRTAAQFGLQVAEALDHAHTRGILHRDIKPGNLLLDDQGQLWVTDFGLAQVQGNPCLTLTGDILGTLRYMSPEQALAKRVVIDGRTDIYSLGVTLFELLTLRPAVDGQDRQEILGKIAGAEPPPPRQLNPAVPRDLETILLKAMAKEPSGRYATAKDMADELRRFLDHKPIKARRPSLFDRAAKWARRHKPVVATGAAGLVVAMAILAGGIGWIVSDRTARLAMTEREVSRALDDAAVFQAQAKWPEALEAAKRADGILTAGASEDLRRRVRELLKDVKMVLNLEEIWMPREARVDAGDAFSPRRAVAYANAFREFGIDVEALEPSVATARIRARKVRLELALALDLWARAQGCQAGDASRRRLLAVARAADPDKWRNQMRAALDQRDYKTLNSLAASAPSSDLPVQTLSLLVAINELDMEQRRSLLRQAQQAHPDNFHINFQLAWILTFAPQQHVQLDDGIRFFTAALALRPRDVATCYWLATALGGAGRVDEQIAHYHKAIVLDPSFLRAYRDLSKALQAQGKRDEAIEVLRKARQSKSGAPNDLNELAWLLATCRFLELRDPPRAVELAQKAVELAPQIGDYWNTLGAAHYRAGNWKGAIAGFETSMALRRSGDSFDWFFLAMTNWQLGERDKARQWYDRAVHWMEKNRPNNEELRRFRAEAEELMQIKDRAQSETKTGPR